MKFLPTGALLLASIVCVQQPAQNTPTTTPAPKPTGTVTGHVFASDTQRPARFAQVVLLWKKPKSADDDDDDDEKKPAAQPEMLTGRSGLDGSFTIPNVPAGDYYIFGEMAGYMLPFKRLTKAEQEDATNETNMEKALADVSLIHVSADHTTTREITIQRGAVISGRVVYDDGAPGTTMLLNLQTDDGDDPLNGSFPGALQNAFLQSRGIVFTDDRGQFRITNVSPGKYRVCVTLVTENNSQWADGRTMSEAPTSAQRMSIYAPGKFRKSEAKMVEIKGSEEVSDVEIKLALDLTHTVSGFIFSKEDHHAPNHSFVELTDPTGEMPERQARVNEQGQFHFSYVPSGTYELLVRGMDSVWASDPHRAAGQGWMIATAYEPVKQSVIVGDQDVKVDDVMVEAVKKNPSESQ